MMINTARNMNSLVWIIHGFICWILFGANLYIFFWEPLKITIAGQEILSISSPQRSFIILVILFAAKIIWDPSMKWAIRVLSKPAGYLHLLIISLAAMLHGFGLFTHLHYEYTYAYWSGDLQFSVFKNLLYDYLFTFLLISYFGTWIYCRKKQDPQAAFKYYARSLSWGFLFFFTLTPFITKIPPRLLFMLLIPIYSLTIAQLFLTNNFKLPSAKILIGIGIIVYSALLVLLLIKSYLPRNYDDFPFFIQSLYSLLNGKLMYVSWLFDPDGPGMSYIGDHFSPFLLLLLPFFALWGGPEIFIIAQVLAVSLAAIPLYYLCRHKFPNQSLLILTVPFVYLMTPWIQKGFFFDFHQDAFKPIFIFLSFLALEKRRRLLYAISMFCLLSTKEDAFLIPIFFGLYAGLFLKEWKIGLLSIVAGLCWAVLVMGYIMPSFYPDDAVYRHVANRYAQLGDTHKDILSQVLLHPVETLVIIFDQDIMYTLLYLFIPLACLPILSLRGLILMTPFIAQMLLSSWKYTRTIYFYYPFAVYPLVIIALILGLERIRKRFSSKWLSISTWFSLFLLSATCIFSLFYKTHILPNTKWIDHYYLHEAPFSYQFNPAYYTITKRNHLAHQFIKEQIPSDVSLSVPVRYAAHLSQRQILRMFPNLHGVDYVFLDLFGLPFAKDPSRMKQSILDFLKRDDFGVITEIDGFILLRKGADTALNKVIIERESRRFEVEDLPQKEIGVTAFDPYSKNGLVRYVNLEDGNHRLLSYGPYTTLSSGNYTAMVSLKTSNLDKQADVIIIKVTSEHGRQLHAEKKISSNEFNQPYQYQEFLFDFSLKVTAEIEFPIIHIGEKQVWIDYIRFEKSFDKLRTTPQSKKPAQKK